MTTKDFFIKWLAYTLALLPLWFLQELLLSRYPLMGVKPMLLPLWPRNGCPAAPVPFSLVRSL